MSAARQPPGKAGEDKQRRLESAVAALQLRYGDQAVRKASELAIHTVPHIATGFPAVDALTGCGGLPLRASTLLTGQMTSGKLTLAYKALVVAQAVAGPVRRTGPQPAVPMVAILDLAASTNPDYLQRCGLRLEQTLIARPPSARTAVDLLLDLVQSRSVRAILVDSLVDLAADAAGMRYLASTLAKLERLLEQSDTLVIWIDEPEPAWRRLFNWDRGAVLRQHAALQLLFQQESFRPDEAAPVPAPSRTIGGYQARVRVLRSRWAPAGGAATIQIHFNGTVQARATW
jgi:hypothetical protein